MHTISKILVDNSPKSGVACLFVGRTLPSVIVALLHRYILYFTCYSLNFVQLRRTTQRNSSNVAVEVIQCMLNAFPVAINVIDAITR